MKIIKSGGVEAVFNKNNIIRAIQAANQRVGLDKRFTNNEIKEIAKKIEDCCKKETRTLNSGDIQVMVENEIMTYGKHDVAREYITYRYNKALESKKNTTDASILSLLDDNNEELKQENANKNPTVINVQRDYMAGEVSKDICHRYLIPEDIWKAHKEGIIHFHDMDYFANRIHNCLDKSTKFITNEGVKTFEDFNDGDAVTVLTKNGKWKNAIVKCYGKDKLFKYTFYNGKKSIVQEVIATENHRWYLKDNSVTTSLSVGDKLIKAPVIYEQDKDYETFDDIQKGLWCMGFAFGDGVIEHSGYSTRIRLCGKKDNDWLNRFDNEYCSIRGQKIGTDHIVAIKNYQKTVPDFRNVNDVRAFLNGLYCADGKMSINNPHSRMYRIQSSKKEVIDFIRKYAPICGLYITKETDFTGQKTNYTESRPYTIQFSFNPNFKFSYTVLSKEFLKEDEVWCLEVEDEHNFVLYNGIVTGNCDLVNLKDMLQNGTVISGVKIDKPHRFSTAATIASQIAQQVSSSQYGGQSMNMSNLSPFINESRKSFRKRLIECGMNENDEHFNTILENMVIKDVEDGVQTFVYQLNTMSGTNGQSPFITLFMYLDDVPNGQEKDDLALLIQKILEQRIVGFKNKQGVYIAPAFPKLIYVLDEDNITEDSKYWYLTKLAAECTAKRMVPDYVSAKVMKELKDGNVYTPMGCRSFLTPAYVDKNDPWKITTKKKGVPKFEGRFNQGVVTINLPDVALSSNKDIEKFWYILDERLELCHRALRLRHERLRGVKSDIAPILWQNGAIARLKPGETIDNLLYNGYSTISLGYVGLYECVKYLTGKDHWVSEEEGGALEFAQQVMQKLNDKCKQWKEIEHIDYSVYGTPEESTTQKFAQSLQRRFGIIKGITDKNYVTNSYHIPVFHEIDAFSKLTYEAQLQKLSPGGAISYIEAPNMVNNIDAILTLLKHMYNTIMYSEINFKLDYCENCGYHGAFEIKDIDGKLQFVCPNCGEKEFDHNPTRLRPCRRVCGYISSHQMNQGRMGDMKNRCEHC